MANLRDDIRDYINSFYEPICDELMGLRLYCFSSGSSNDREMNNKPPAMPVRLNGFSEKIPPMLR